MARKIEEIKQAITDAWMQNATVQMRYNLGGSTDFAASFSAVSLENIIFYIVAYATWVVEKLVDVHRAEVDAALLAKMPHTARWYREKVLRFRAGQPLLPESDRYGDVKADGTPYTAAEIAEMEVVKYCAVNDTGTGGVLRVKVAGGEAGNRHPITDEQQALLNAYLAAVADAGVGIEVVNQQSDKLRVKATVWYNPLALVAADKPVEAAIKAYASNLDFNGALSGTKLVDAMQAVPGVELVKMDEAKVQSGDATTIADLGVQRIAESGYWVVDESQDTAARKALDITYEIYNGNANI